MKRAPEMTDERQKAIDEAQGTRTTDWVEIIYQRVDPSEQPGTEEWENPTAERREGPLIQTLDTRPASIYSKPDLQVEISRQAGTGDVPDASADTSFLLPTNQDLSELLQGVHEEEPTEPGISHLGTSGKPSGQTLSENASATRRVKPPTVNPSKTTQHDKGVPGNHGNSVLQNILASTRHFIDQNDPTKHVSTYVERSALKSLKTSGSVFLKGRSGTGKTWTGLRLLSEMSKEGYKPLVLSFARDWKLIPKTGHNYVVMIDDIFGSSNLFQSQVEQWMRLFNIMWPSVESGEILLLFTSRPEIYAQCEQKIKKYEIIYQTPVVILDEDRFCLRPSEKARMVRKYCGKRIPLTFLQIEEIKKIHTSLGFPQCCEFFASNKMAQVRGVSFFLNPQMCLKEAISVLKESNPLGFFVLQLVMLNKGKLKHDFLKMKQPPGEFSFLCQELTDISNLAAVPSRGAIRKTADSVCSVFLGQSDNAYSFKHQSIFDAVFLDMALDYPERCVRICPAKMLVELVRTEEHQSEEHEVVIRLTQDKYDVLADRLTEILQSKDAVDVWDHPSLRNGTFLVHLMSKWNDDIIIHVMSRTRTQSSRQLTSDIQYVNLDEVNILIHAILVDNEILGGHLVLKFKGSLSEYVNSSVLALVLSRSLSWLGEVLVDCGIFPDANCFRAICYSESLNVTVTERILNMSEIHAEMVSHEEVSRLLVKATLNGNMSAVNVLFDIVMVEKDIAYDSLLNLFYEIIQEYFKDSSQPTINTVMNRLLSFDFEQSHLNKLAGVSSGHRHSLCLKTVLDKGVTLSPEEWQQYMLNAIRFGGTECIEELIRFGPDRHDVPEQLGDFLGAAAIAGFDSGSKMKTLLKHFAKVSSHLRDEDLKPSVLDSNHGADGTVLSNALKQGNSEAALLLIQEGADVNSRNFAGVTPLQFAVSSCHSCVTELINAGADVNTKGYYQTSVLLYADNTDNIKKLVQGGSNINDIDMYGRSALYLAVERNDLDAVKFLTTKGANVNHVDREGRSVIHVACQYGDVDMIRTLSERDAVIQAVDNEGKSVLHYATQSVCDSVENLQYLVDNLHVTVDCKDRRGRTALFLAAQSGDNDVVEILLEKGANINHTDYEGNTLLHAVCEISQPGLHMVKFLHEAGINPDLCNKGNKKALHIVLLTLKLYSKSVHFDSSSLEQCILFLKEKTSNTNQPDSDGESPLHLAASVGNVQYIKLLLGDGDNTLITKPDRCGQTPLHRAVSSGDVQCVTLMIDRSGGTIVNQSDSSGKTPLHLAARNGGVQCMELLLDKGADSSINEGDRDGRNPLHFAAWYGNDKCVELLLNSGGHQVINQSDIHGKTPLHLAAEAGDVKRVETFLVEGGAKEYGSDGQAMFPLIAKNNAKCVELLLQNGADRSINNCDSSGCTPVHLAAKTRDVQRLELLLKKATEKSITQGDNDGKTPLHLAAELGDVQCLQLLMENGADSSINDKDYAGRSPLHLAAKANSDQCVKMLLEKGAGSDINEADNDGKTPLHLAVWYGDVLCVKMLLHKGADRNIKDHENNTPAEQIPPYAFWKSEVIQLLSSNTS